MTSTIPWCPTEPRQTSGRWPSLNSFMVWDFSRFYRTDSSRNSSKGGSGIGLSIVKKIIEDHGGRIWATSKEGIGTEMHFVLRKYQEVLQNEQQNSDH